ncbi:MAG: sporulation membrane protein YtaF [Peptostreptococcaceae bacterium]
MSLILVLSLCIDTFVASIAYGSDNIKIPFKTAFLINLICTSFLGFSLLVGYLLKDLLSSNTATIFSCGLLFMLGIYKVFEAFIKDYLKKFTHNQTPINFSLFDFEFVLEVYADEIKADYDNSKTLSPKEAIYLASALSLDSLAVGFGASLSDVNHFEVIILSFVIGTLSILSGVLLGKSFRKFSNINFTWVSGVLLITLSFIKFFGQH